jgi:uncharacterized membrane protein YecN with MAPEG domain
LPLTCVKHPAVLVVSKIYHVIVAVKMCGKILARLLEGDNEKSVGGRKINIRWRSVGGVHSWCFFSADLLVNLFVAFYGN